MKTITYNCKCPGCGTDVKAKTRKPTYVVPVTSTQVCPGCDSRIVILTSLGRGEKKGLINYTMLSIHASGKLLALMELRRLASQKEETNETENQSQT